MNIVKKLVYLIVGLFSYPGLVWFNKLRISGTENIDMLPNNNVLFVSNHQTYFADVICFLQIFSAIKWGRKNRLGFPVYLLNPRTQINYVAAEKTMSGTLLSRFFKLAGAITVKRTWNETAKESLNGLEISDTRNIERALQENWVITFPQGTTTPYAPGRKGTALIIKVAKPIVIPVVIDGFSAAFNKTGLRLKKWNTKLSVSFKPPINIDYTQSTDIITKQLMDAIEQSAAFNLSQKKVELQMLDA